MIYLKNTDFYECKENIRYLSILFLFLMNIYFESKLDILVLTWILLLIVNGNNRRISYKKKGLYFVRSTFYFIFTLTPFVFAYKINFGKSILSCVIACAISVLISVLIFFLERKKWKLYLSKAVILSTEKMYSWTYICLIYVSICSAICEELFFRNFILTISNRVPLVILCMISIVYFFLYHFTLKWSKSFSLYDFCKQILVACLSVILFLVSKSIIPSILLHLFMNLPVTLLYVKQYYLFYIKNEVSDNIEEEELKELDLF